MQDEAAGKKRDVLSRDVEIVGSITFHNELLIDGRVEGDIRSDGMLTVGENGEVNGDVSTGSITVHGRVVGNITATGRCDFKSNSYVEGEVKAGRMSVEDGAVLKVSMNTGGSAKESAQNGRSAKPRDQTPSVAR